MNFQYFIKNPQRILIAIAMRCGSVLPDKVYLKLLYRCHVHKKLNLENPKTFSEKLQWLKLYDRRDDYTVMVDKVAVKSWVAERVGVKYIIPTLAQWDTIEQLDISSLPNQFVLKTNNGGGGTGVVICRNKKSFNMESAREKLQKSLHSNLYKSLVEWPYKNLKPKVFAEAYMEDERSQDLVDYKFYCFDGVVKYCQVIQNRHTHETIDFFDTQWNHQPFIGLTPNVNFAEIQMEMPNTFEEMCRVATVLSKNIPFCRVDLYDINERVYFGEITFFPMSGLGQFRPSEWNIIIGNEIHVPFLDVQK